MEKNWRTHTEHKFPCAYVCVPDPDKDHQQRSLSGLTYLKKQHLYRCEAGVLKVKLFGTGEAYSGDQPIPGFPNQYNLRGQKVDHPAIEALIETHKPAYTRYILEFGPYGTGRGE